MHPAVSSNKLACGLIHTSPNTTDLSELDQLPAPDIGDNDVLPKILLTTLKKTSESLNAGNEIPPDILIDPDGRIVAFSRQFGQK